MRSRAVTKQLSKFRREIVAAFERGDWDEWTRLTRECKEVLHAHGLSSPGAGFHNSAEGKARSLEQTNPIPLVSLARMLEAGSSRNVGLSRTLAKATASPASQDLVQLPAWTRAGWQAFLEVYRGREASARMDRKSPGWVEPAVSGVTTYAEIKKRMLERLMNSAGPFT